MITIQFFSLDELGAKRYQFSLRITNELKRKFNLLAEYKGVTFCEAVTLLIERYIDFEIEELMRIQNGLKRRELVQAPKKSSVCVGG